MLSFRFSHVCIESYAFDSPPYEVTSAEIEDRVAPLYEKLEVPFGTLERLSGIKSRRCYPADERPSVIAARAGKEAIERSGIDPALLKVLFNCSVTRDFFEPATASLVHRELGFPETTMSLDITNACIGFSNGMLLLANLIESGVVKAGLLVSAENLSRITDATFRLMQETADSIDRAELLRLMPTFTLGSGGAAVVLCHESVATKGHKLLGAVSRSASEHSDLCVGNGDFCFMQDPSELNPIMHTDSPKLIGEAAKLGARVWNEASELFGWKTDDIDRIFCHQVGKQLGAAFYKTMGLPIEKEYIVYPRLGNLVSAALPSALINGAEEGVISSGDKILLTAFGSGLNAIFTGIEW